MQAAAPYARTGLLLQLLSLVTFTFGSALQVAGDASRRAAIVFLALCFVVPLLFYVAFESEMMGVVHCHPARTDTDLRLINSSVAP